MTAQSRWSDGREEDPDYGERYAARFAALAESGSDIHGEATFCTFLAPTGSHVLDAGCGTGRVAIRLAELGYHCVGVDSDAAMLAVAQRAATTVEWHLIDLVDVTALDEVFDLIVAAGNVMPLLAAGSEQAVLSGLASRLSPGGVMVAGFGLDVAHLPLDEVPFGLDQYDEWCSDAGLELADRYATWAGEPFVDASGGYAVSVHRRRNSGAVQR